MACVTAFVAAGSMYEWPDSTGVCHLLEHTAFKSTANDSADAVWGKATEAGISLSAANSREVLSYRADCVRDSMPLALGLLADTLSCPLITDAEVQVAKVRRGWQRCRCPVVSPAPLHLAPHAANR